jgi:hypothetical protein
MFVTITLLLAAACLLPAAGKLTGRQSETTPAGVAVPPAVAVPRAVAPELPVHPATETTLSSSAVESRRARHAPSGQARQDSHVRTARTAAISLTQDAAERT